jgi:2-hydroxy-6-oxonona-2,4-dienedioate hydrolase
MSGALGFVGRRTGPPRPAAGAPTFVLLHGLGLASRMAMPTATRLADHGPVLAPDLPGFGAAAGEPRPPFPELAARVASGIRRLQPPVVLLGCSLGAQIAVHAAAELGDLAALVLVSPTMDPARRSLPAQLRRWPLELVTQPPWFVRIQTQDHGEAGPRRLLDTVREAVADRPEDRAPAITAPTLVVRGTRDPLVSTGWASDLAGAVPDAELAVLPARHAMTALDPDVLVAATLPFLSRRGVRSAPSPVGPPPAA